MKKALIILFLILTTGCGAVNNSNGSKDTIRVSDIKGYWLQIEENWSGDVTNLTDNPYAYLEITDERLFFYTISFDEDEGYGVAEKYYRLEENNLYYDYDELKDRSLKEIADSTYGGIFMVSFNDDNLVLKEYNNGLNEDDGYEINTYKKIGAEDWPIEE